MVRGEPDRLGAAGSEHDEGDEPGARCCPSPPARSSVPARTSGSLVVMSSSRRRGTRSASAPPNGPSTALGTNPAAATSPVQSRLVRRLGDEDADAEGLHPRADVRHEGSGPQDREHAVPERRERAQFTPRATYPWRPRVPTRDPAGSAALTWPDGPRTATEREDRRGRPTSAPAWRPTRRSRCSRRTGSRRSGKYGDAGGWMPHIALVDGFRVVVFDEDLDDGEGAARGRGRRRGRPGPGRRTRPSGRRRRARLRARGRGPRPRRRSRRWRMSTFPSTTTVSTAALLVA